MDFGKSFQNSRSKKPTYFLYFLKQYHVFLQDPVAPSIGEKPINDLGIPVSEYHDTVSSLLNEKTEPCSPGCASQLSTAETT